MSIVNTSIRYAVAVALAGTAASAANALSISTYAGNAATNVNVYISGSTALDSTLTNAAIQTAAGQVGMCVSGTTDIYLIGTSQKLIYCTGSSASGVSGSPLAIFKESAVGSANGVQPLINVAKGLAAGTNFINPAVITDATCGTATTTNATGDFGTYVTHPSCATTAIIAHNPTGGFADVEAAILQTAAGSTINATDTSTYLTASATLDQVWAIALTKNMYYALQTAEGLTSTCPASFTVYGTAVTGTSFLGKDSPSCAPSLSKQQVASLLTQQIATGTQLGITNTTDDTVYLCRRDYGSGTEASFEAYFVGERCSLTGLSVPGEDGFAVWAAGSGGGVRTCLQAFNAGGKTLTGYYGTYTLGTVGNQYAVGFINTEITAANLSGASDGFRLVAIDGVLPQIANVQNGTYPYFSTGNSYQIKAGQPGAPTGSSLTAFNAITGKIGHPIWTADSNTNYSKNPWGVAGDVSPAGLYASSNPPTLPATHTSASTNPTNAFTKTAGGKINNCDQPVFDSLLPAAPVETLLLGTGTVNN
jgi:hypothetical protein